MSQTATVGDVFDKLTVSLMKMLLTKKIPPVKTAGGNG
jgi:hypothetical protein